MGTVVVTKRPVSSPAELELDQVILELDLRHHDLLAPPNRSSVSLEPRRDLRKVDRLRGPRIDVDTVLRPGHLELDQDRLSLEKPTKVLFGLGLSRARAEKPDRENQRHVSHLL